MQENRTIKWALKHDYNQNTGENGVNIKLLDVKRNIKTLLDKNPKEVAGLKWFIQKGQLDGRYESDINISNKTKCSCIYSTLGKVCEKTKGKKLSYSEIRRLTCKLSSFNNHTSLEKFIYNVKKGHTPENSEVMKFLFDQIEEWEQKQLQKVEVK